MTLALLLPFLSFLYFGGFLFGLVLYMLQNRALFTLFLLFVYPAALPDDYVNLTAFLATIASSALKRKILANKSTIPDDITVLRIKDKDEWAMPEDKD